MKKQEEKMSLRRSQSDIGTTNQSQGVSEIIWGLPRSFVARNDGRSKGFTLIELLVVLTIIGILATFTLVNFLNTRTRARDAQRKADLQQLRSAFEMYRADQGTYPPSPLPTCGSSLLFGTTTYMKKVPCDPTNSGQFVYRYLPVGSGYTLVSCLENGNDAQKDMPNNSSYCAGTSTNWSYTLTNP